MEHFLAKYIKTYIKEIIITYILNYNIIIILFEQNKHEQVNLVKNSRN